MLVAALTLTLFGIIAMTLGKIVRDDSGKIVAALQGRSWMSEPPSPIRPVTVRYTPRYPVSRPVRVVPELRAAA